MGGTIHVFVPNRHSAGISFRCMKSYNEFRQFTLDPEGGARSNSTLFDNSQQKNSECRELRTWKQSPRQWPCADSERVFHIDWQRSIL